MDGLPFLPGNTFNDPTVSTRYTHLILRFEYKTGIDISRFMMINDRSPSQQLQRPRRA